MMPGRSRPELAARSGGDYHGDANRPAPDFVSTHTALHGQERLLSPVDPDAANSSEQLVRALRVIKRMGVYCR